MARKIKGSGKKGSSNGTVPCNMCHGTGKVKKSTTKK